VAGFSAGGGAGNYEIGRQAMLRMAATFRIDPDWQQNTQRHLGSANDAMVQASNAAEDIMLQSARSSMASHERIAQKWSDITLGQQHVCDELNRCRETTNACDYVWSLADDFVCGPSDGSPPDSRGWHLTHRTQ
jgi:hypothetical protein